MGVFVGFDGFRHFIYVTACPCTRVVVELVATVVATARPAGGRALAAMGAVGPPRRPLSFSTFSTFSMLHSLYSRSWRKAFSYSA